MPRRQDAKTLTACCTTDIAGTAYMIQPVVFTWANRVLSRDGDDAARAFTLYSMNGMSAHAGLLRSRLTDYCDRRIIRSLRLLGRRSLPRIRRRHG